MAGSNFSVGGVAEKVVGGVLSGLILLALAGGVGMGWIRLEEWWWAAPLLYALVTGGLIFGILYGLSFQIRARLYWLIFTVLLACMFGVLLYVDSGGLKQTAVVPSLSSPTPCQVPLTKKDRERILAFLYEQFLKSEPVKREVVKIVVGPGKKNDCPYATDLQRIFSTGGWAKDKIKIEESDPQGTAVWFQGPLNDELALTFFEQVLCYTSQEVYHQRHPSLGVGQWQFFIGDGYGVGDYAKYGISKELHEVTCPETRSGGRQSPSQRKQTGRKG
jgi:hypothetical protein